MPKPPPRSRTKIQPRVPLLFAGLLGFLGLQCAGKTPKPSIEMGERPAAATSAAKAALDFLVQPKERAPVNFKTAALYVRLLDDTFGATGSHYSDSLRCLVEQWPVGATDPTWKGELLVTRPWSASTWQSDLLAKPYSVTTFWYQMSGGRLWVWGDEITYAGPPVRRAGSKSDWQENNRQILQWFADAHDLRSLDNDADGAVDMIMMINRARPKFSFGRAKSGHYQGVANGDYLPSPVIIRKSRDRRQPVIKGHTNVQQNSGTYQTDVYALSDRHIILHEMGHRLLKTSHFNGQHRFSLMAGAGSRAPTRAGLVLSAWEKMNRGWLEPQVVSETRRNVVIGDVTGDNAAVKVPVATGYFLIEYRRNRPYFEQLDEPACPDVAGLPEGVLVSFCPRGGQPIICPADGRVHNIGSRGAPRFNGDNSDLFGAHDRARSLTPYTNPPSVDSRRRRTGLAIKNIRTENGQAQFDVFLNYWEGPIRSNTRWQGDVYVGGDLTVQRNAKLRVAPGTRVTVAEGARVTIEGALDIENRDGRAAVFAGENGRNWAGLHVATAARARSSLKNISIRDAAGGER